MAPLSFDALLRSLKRGDPEAVYYLHGEEDVLKDEAVRALVDRAVPPESRDFNLDTRTAAELDVESLHALLNTPPMLAPRRAVVLRGIEQLRKKSRPRDALLAYLEHPSPDTLLVLVQTDSETPEADLTARATAVVMDRLPPERAVRWVAHAAGLRAASRSSQRQPNCSWEQSAPTSRPCARNWTSSPCSWSGGRPVRPT